MARGPDKRLDIGKPVHAADADHEHFTRAMAGVVRVAPDPRGRVRVAPPVRTRPSEIASGRERASGTSGHVELNADTDSATGTGFTAPGVDRRELRKLKRGDHAPAVRLDLHGMTAADAVARVTRFIDSARPRHRCVAIVHGRGLHSAGQIAILKTRVRACLRQHGGVLAYADAPHGDGGSGAVHVLLRR